MNARHPCLAVLMCLLAAPLQSAPPEASQAPAAVGDLALARAKTQAFGQQLKQTLMTALQAGGPPAAVEACRLQAPALAAAQTDGHWRVGRTSDRLRNPTNAPDPWERAVLADFANQLAKGADLANLEQLQPTGTGFRYMKAIGVEAPCLACHGANIEPALAAQLDRLYPGDQARGYQLGELRGAFSLTYRR